MKTVALFRSSYLPLSETFISDHLRSLVSYRPIVMCEFDLPAAHRIDIAPTVVPGGRIGRSLFRRFGWAPTLKKAIERSDASIFHIHFLVDAAIALPFIEKIDVPVVVTAHGYDATLSDEALNEFPEGRMLIERRERLIKRVDRIICVSDFIRDELLLRGYPAEKLMTLPLGVDTDALTPRSPEILGRGILAVGRLVEKKGMHKLIEAYSMLPLDLRTAHQLTIVGDGPLHGALFDQARSFGVDVEFAGGLPRSEVLERIRAAAIFCLPSVRAKNGDAEGMGIVIMEAMAQGVPVVIFNDQPMAKMLSDRAAGVVAAAGNAIALAQSLMDILDNTEEAARLSMAGREFCCETFSLAKNTRQLENLYDEISLGYT